MGHFLKRIKVRLVFLIVLTFLMAGCSAKQVLDGVKGFNRFQTGMSLKTKTVEDNVTLAYLENNVKSDSVLVFVHGFAMEKDFSWLGVVKELQTKVHIVIPDLIGNGESSKPLEYDYSLTNQAKTLHALLKTYDDKKIILVGHSMGGGISLEYVANYGNVEKLVLINAMGVKAKDSVIEKLGEKKLREIYLNVCTKEQLENAIRYAYKEKPYIPDFILNHLLDERCKESKLDEKNYNSILHKKLDPKFDFSNRLESLKLSTLILWGKDDQILDVANAQKFHNLLPNSQLELFDVGHQLMLEDTKGVAKAIDEFLVQ